MLQRDTFIEDIRKGLAALQIFILPGGTLNLTDANVQAEDFVAGLLNVIYGWELVSTNRETANYPCIDLIDKKRGLGVGPGTLVGLPVVTGTILRRSHPGLFLVLGRRLSSRRPRGVRPSLRCRTYGRLSQARRL